MSDVLITGGAGFIGSHLAKTLLAAGRRLRILDCLSPQIHGALPCGLDWLRDERVTFIRGSVTQAADVEAALGEAGTVVHLAAETGTGQSMYQIARYNEVNVGGTAVLLDVLANDPGRRVKRIVLASSRSIYGEGAYACPSCAGRPRVHPEARSAERLAAGQWEHACPACGSALAPVPTREDDPAKPASIYAASKRAQEDLVRIAAASLGMDHAILRLQNVYGEGQSLHNPYTGILSIFSTRVRRSQHLPIFEDGRETRDFVHVQDVVDAMVSAIDHPGTIADTINVGMGVATTVADVALQLSRAFGVVPDIVTTGQYRVGDIRHNFADTARLQAVLQRSARISLEEGMRRFVAWVRSQPLPEDGLDRANAELKARNLMN